MIIIKKILPIAIVLIVAVVGGYFLLNKSGGSMMPGVTVKTGSKGEVFTGTLKMAYEKGIPLNCTWTNQEGVEAEGKIKGKNYRGVISQDGKKSNIIMKENCMWVWGDDIKQGMKTCFEDDLFEMEPEDYDMPEGTDIQANPSMPQEVTCRPGLFSDEVFVVPSEVEFMDFDSMQNM